MRAIDEESLAAGSADPSLQVYLLGTIDFEAALTLQRQLVYQVSGEPDSAALILCEHPPLITVGRQGSRAHIHFEPEELQAWGWPVRWVNRGGGCWLHLPGQLAIYAVMALPRHSCGLQEYMSRLQQVMASALEDFSVASAARPGQVGLWAGGRPIASVGVAVRGWVSYYGAILNIHPDLAPYRFVRSAPDAEAMTSLVRERGGPIRPAFVRERIVEGFGQRFGFERTSIFFDHPALRRKAASDAVIASR